MVSSVINCKWDQAFASSVMHVLDVQFWLIVLEIKLRHFFLNFIHWFMLTCREICTFISVKKYVRLIFR